MTRPARHVASSLSILLAICLGSGAAPVPGQEVNASSNPAAVYSETAVAINPADPRIIAVGANRIAGGGAMPVFVSRDRGATFTRTDLSHTIAGVTYYSAADPSLAFDAVGNAYYCYMLSSGTLGEQYHPVVATLKAGQTQWLAPRLVAGALGDDDKPYLAVDASVSSPYSGRVYVAWDRNATDGSQSILIAHSVDGYTWQPAIRVDDPATTTGSVIYAMPATGPNGELYVVWNDYGGGTGGTLRFDRSLDGGDTFGNDTVVSDLRLNLQPNPADPYSAYTIPAQPSRGIAACPSIGVDTSTGPRRGWIYVCYGDRIQNHTNADVDIFVRHSSDGGATWSAPVRVNDDSGATSQFFPWMSVDPVDGSINVTFYDCRNDPNNRKADVYYARSLDGGATFEPNVRVTSVPSDESTGVADPTGNDYGDYAGVAAYGGQIVPAWTDSRGGYNQAYITTLVQPAFAPLGLTQTALNLSVPIGTTINSRYVTLNALLGGPAASLKAEWEIKPLSSPFNGTGTSMTTAPSFAGAPVPVSTSLSLLANGAYQWRVRSIRADGLTPPSEWSEFTSGTAFRIGGASMTMADAARALAVYGGMVTAVPSDAWRLDVIPPDSGCQISVSDAVRIIRSMAGLDVIP